MLFITEVVRTEDSLTFLYRNEPDGSAQHKGTWNCFSASCLCSYSAYYLHWLIDLYKEKHNYFLVTSSWINSVHIPNYALRCHRSENDPAADKALGLDPTTEIQLNSAEWRKGEQLLGGDVSSQPSSRSRMGNTQPWHHGESPSSDCVPAHRTEHTGKSSPSQLETEGWCGTDLSIS